MAKWLIPTLSEILQQNLSTPYSLNLSATLAKARQRAEWAWSGAIASLGQLLQLYPSETDGGSKGVILCGPLPLFTDPEVLRPFTNWIFIPDLLASYWHNPPQLLPGSRDAGTFSPMPFLPLLPEDPLALEQFCLVLTSDFGLVLVIGDDRYGLPHFQFSFNAQILFHCCQVLIHRLDLTGCSQRDHLQETLDQFPVRDPSFQIVSEWMRLLLDRVDLPASEGVNHPSVSSPSSALASSAPSPSRSETIPLEGSSPVSNIPLNLGSPGTSTGGDIKLLQALAHEIRTPLATIRTLTRLLLKRQDLSPTVLQRLQSIDQECTEQIDRFGLIFRAAELESSARDNVELTPTDLSAVFADNLPRWQAQAQRRCLHLRVSLPERLPTVFSDGDMLNQVLTSLLDRFIRHLPPQSEIEMQVFVAGNQLKLQLQSLLPPLDPHAPLGPSLADDVAEDWRVPSFSEQFQALGNLLLLQPETGRLSLNLDVTKNLFQAIGGKLLIREKVDHGEVITVFLPLHPLE